MSKPTFRQYDLGSAERVIAHAAWQRSRGRGPSMTFITEHNPRQALRLARAVVANAKLTDLVIASPVRRRSFAEMTDTEIKIAVAQVIRTSNSADEVKQRLRAEYGSDRGISLHVHQPTDEVGRQARELCRGLGGLTLANGAMVMAMLHGHNNTINL
jgi:hypothetical protein